jgi:hypothetical protein
VAACRNGCDTPGHRCHREFFSAALKLDNHSLWVTENAPESGNGYKAWKPIEVLKQLEFCHCHSMTSFSSKGKTLFSENCCVFVASKEETYPLKNAKSLLLFAGSAGSVHDARSFGALPDSLQCDFDGITHETTDSSDC